jgi:leader peptidase (prepilin peptidase) / N-methyltransferase
MTRHALIAAALGSAALTGAGLLATASALTLARLGVGGAALAACALYDLRQRRIPNRIVLPAAAVCAFVTLADRLSLSLLAGLAVVLILLMVCLRWPAAFGMGDVKLTLLVVLALDGSALRALTIGVALAAVAGLIQIARHGSAAWRTALPLAPFVAAGALTAVIT